MNTFNNKVACNSMALLQCQSLWLICMVSIPCSYSLSNITYFLLTNSGQLLSQMETNSSALRKMNFGA